MAFVPSHFSVIFQMPSLPSFAASWAWAERQSIAQRLCFYGIHLDFSIASGVLKSGKAPVVGRATIGEIHRTDTRYAAVHQNGILPPSGHGARCRLRNKCIAENFRREVATQFSSQVIPHAQPSRIAQTRSQRSDTRGRHKEQIRPKPGLYGRALV
jgi:hypothetical protein